ncbi:MAG TPA: hypothetical protein PKD55_09680 [Bellilinea sp.]|nr:hypothetical protein [Bellilinea sp.]
MHIKSRTSPGNSANLTGVSVSFANFRGYGAPIVRPWQSFLAPSGILTRLRAKPAPPLFELVNCRSVGSSAVCTGQLYPYPLLCLVFTFARLTTKVNVVVTVRWENVFFFSTLSAWNAYLARLVNRMHFPLSPHSSALSITEDVIQDLGRLSLESFSAEFAFDDGNFCGRRKSCLPRLSLQIIGHAFSRAKIQASVIALGRVNQFFFSTARAIDGYFRCWPIVLAFCAAKMNGIFPGFRWLDFNRLMAGKAIYAYSISKKGIRAIPTAEVVLSSPYLGGNFFKSLSAIFAFNFYHFSLHNKKPVGLKPLLLSRQSGSQRANMIIARVNKKAAYALCLDAFILPHFTLETTETLL